MTKKQAATSRPLTDIALGPHTVTSAPHQDEYAGHGGSYTLDPKTGKRTLIQRTQPRAELVPEDHKE